MYNGVCYLLLFFLLSFLNILKEAENSSQSAMFICFAVQLGNSNLRYWLEWRISAQLHVEQHPPVLATWGTLLHYCSKVRNERTEDQQILVFPTGFNLFSCKLLAKTLKEKNYWEELEPKAFWFHMCILTICQEIRNLLPCRWQRLNLQAPL